MVHAITVVVSGRKARAQGDRVNEYVTNG
jgi:hypothetical protein